MAGEASETTALIDEASRALREGRVDDVVRLSTRVADLLDAHASGRAPVMDAGGPADPMETLRAASLLQAAFRFSGVEALHDRGVTLARRFADHLHEPALAVRARSILATFHIVSGRFRAMADTCDAAIELASGAGLAEDPVVAMAHQFRGYARFEWNRLDEARRDLEAAWSLAGPEARGVRSGTARMLAAVHSALDDDDEAEQWTERLGDIVGQQTTMRNREWLAAVRVMAQTRTSRDVRAIDAWAHRYEYPLHEGAGPSQAEAASRLHEYEHLLTVLEATSQWEPMLHVADAMELGAGTTRRWFAARAPAARAVALEALGRTDAADEAWATALARGRAHAYVRVFVAGTPIRLRLLERARAGGSTRGEAERILEAASRERAAADRLTERQLEALKHLEAGHSNRSIAVEMGISEATVKTHLRDLYARLGVRSRTQALASARGLGIL